MNVRLHIDRLVIEGIDVPNRKALQAAVEGELGRLISTEGFGAAVAASPVPSVTAPSITVSNATPAHLGSTIGAAVYRTVRGTQ